MHSKHEVPTPALLLDLDAFEFNLELMAQHVRQSGKQLRPHAKAHKCVPIAKRQIEAGASGICVATVVEAELMAKAGIGGILLTSPIADARKAARVVATGAMAVVDHVRQVECYETAAKSAGRMLDVLIDIDVGDHRTGVRSTMDAFHILEAINGADRLRVRGVQAYAVEASHGTTLEERQRVSRFAYQIANEIRRALQEQGREMEILSGGSTGTWNVDTEIEAVTELQAGSYALMDLAYARLGLPFKNGLTVLTTVVSANHDGFVTVDGGFKAFSTDRGYGPEAPAYPESRYRWGGDEFGYLDIEGCGRKPRLGDRIEFIPPHCDPTVHLHNYFYVCRGDTVEDIWPIMERI